ncbi:MAG: transglutaminase-like domain-containing protein [Vicinamibacterales bacterium]|nr:transglutaminase-like domain-containing protein [Vicinamibacterales bacterium]
MSGAPSLLSPELLKEFTKAASSPASGLAEPALLIARLGYPNLDPAPYLARLEEMADTAAGRLAVSDQSAAPHGPIDTLNTYLFEDQGFAGNTSDYDDPRNSFLNQVLDRRTGIPITLALVYIEVARRVGIRVDGVNFPGHFLLRFPVGPDDLHELDARSDSAVFVDPFNQGMVLSETDCRTLLEKHAGDKVSFEPRLLRPATKQQILVRMLVNLKQIYVRMRSFPQGRAITELLLAINPSALSELRDRGLLAYHLNDHAAALRDLETYLKFASRGDDVSEESREERTEIWGHVKALRRRMASLN